MKFYLNTNQIPELKGKTFKQRMSAIDAASAKLTTPEKVLLNTLKLVMLTICFAWIFWLSSLWQIIGAIVLVIIIYPLAIRPLQYTIVSKYLDE